MIKRYTSVAWQSSDLCDAHGRNDYLPFTKCEFHPQGMPAMQSSSFLHAKIPRTYNPASAGRFCILSGNRQFGNGVAYRTDMVTNQEQVQVKLRIDRGRARVFYLNAHWLSQRRYLQHDEASASRYGRFECDRSTTNNLI